MGVQIYFYENFLFIYLTYSNKTNYFVETITLYIYIHTNILICVTFYLLRFINYPLIINFDVFLKKSVFFFSYLFYRLTFYDLSFQ